MRKARRKPRFPFISTILLVALAACVGYLSFMNVDLPRSALQSVRDSVAQVVDGLRLISKSLAEGGITFYDVPEPVLNPVPMLVNAEHPVADDFVPADLVRLRDYCDPKVVYIKGSEIEANRTAADALLVMLRAAIAQGLSDWQISAGYRSVGYQKQLMDNKIYEYRQQGLSGERARAAAARYVATPGASEHHTGLAFDITVPDESFPTTKQSAWLAEHSWEYGFILRYPEEKEAVTGIAYEAWHYRYVGQPHATIMHENGWCLEEYIDSLG